MEKAMDQTTDTEINAEREIVLAFFSRYESAEKALQNIMDEDFPMDRISLLGRASASGDDPLGVYYPQVGERMKGWGKQGALWGGLWGMLAGAAGIFMLPGSGPVNFSPRGGGMLSDGSDLT